MEDQKLNIQKGFTTLEAFNAAYLPHESKQALLHFRIRTHGDYSAENCHPFEVSPNMVFAHNGVLHKMPADLTKSDTFLFNELILKNLIRVYGKRIIFDPTFIPLLEGYSWSKFVFLTNTGKFSIINEKDGKWVSKCWFSNESYQYKYVIPPETFRKKKKNKHLPSLPPPKDYVNPPQHTLNISLPWAIGDYLRLTIPIGIADKGWLGRAMCFYQNGDVEMYFPLHKVTKRVPVIYLEKIVPLLLPPEA